VLFELGINIWERYDDRVGYNPSEWYMDVLLEVIEGPFKGSVFSIDEANAFTFGRAADCTLAVVDDDTIAPLHFQIKVEQPVVWLRAFDSYYGLFYQHFLFRWRYFGLPVSSSADEPDTWDNTMLLYDNKYFLRAGDHKFRLEIERAHACIDCGINLASRRSAPPWNVGHVNLCIDCWVLGSTEFEDNWLAAIYDDAGDVLCVTNEKYDIIMDFVMAKKARLVWLNGFHNNEDYVNKNTKEAYDEFNKKTDELVRKLKDLPEFL